ncbi:MAG: hypothetical protein HYV37_01585 [Candidatus Levyibacteriota bacterium]|nr:MAG: hypothetical protein HYV37_01585 [Candidatus Levybacteria bacterium]
MINWVDVAKTFLESLLGPLVVGLVIWRVGKNEVDKRIKNEAIRDLMTFRGDYSSPEFRRSLNKVSITFHGDEAIRQQIRDLYEDINNPGNSETNINRKIVGLIYNLCRKNGFGGITEYDIDQSFPEQKQTPTSTLTPTSHQVLQDKPKIPKNGKNKKTK